MLKISFDEQERVFHLTNGRISYIMQVHEGGYLLHLYYGKAIDSFNAKRAFYQTEREGVVPAAYAVGRTFSLELAPQEYGCAGGSDFRLPSLSIGFEDGHSVVDLRYKSHRLLPGKPVPKGVVPYSYAEESIAQTLEITLSDVTSRLDLILSYTIFEDVDVITRHSRIIASASESIQVRKLASMSLDFLEADFDRISLYGAHANECNIERHPLSRNIEITSSNRGATSHQHNCFIALARPETTEHIGEVYASALVWSGNFEASTEVTQFCNTRLILGINSFEFCRTLKPGESFSSPEAVLVYSDKGLNGVSGEYHRFIREHILRGQWQKKPRPVLINSWEASYFNFTEDSIVNFAQKAVELGVELVVLDDGWFGKRSKDNCSLGDWTEVNKEKLPNGLKGLADRIHDLGAMFGLWVEPEMVSPDSNLFRAHPDWALGVKGHTRSQGREQYVLDLSRQEVRDHVVNAICEVLSSAPIDYVKWDMNRNLSEVGTFDPKASPDKQAWVSYAYMEGAYEIIKRITEAFPHILFESCAGGGRRFDMGMLCYMPQVWTSDNTDAVCRQRIQYGCSIAYPPLVMGAHVSAVPNHQVGRSTTLLSRFVCAMSGNFGYELDPSKLSESEQQEIKEEIVIYKKVRNTIQFGTFLRLMSPFEGSLNETAWSFISPDEKEVIVMYFKNNATPAPLLRRLRLKGLEPKARYAVAEHIIPQSAAAGSIEYLSNYNLKGDVFGGDELMNFGLTMDKVDADFAAYLLIFHKLD